MTALVTNLTEQVGDIVPDLISGAGAVIGAVAPAALTVAGMVAVVTLGLSIFRRLTGR